jgi:uncharacterized protein (DUF433 family)
MKTPSFINEFVTIDKETVSGVPVFKGTRIAVQTLFDYLNDSSLDDFLVGFPSVSRKQAESVIDWAAKCILSEVAA